MQKDKNHVLFSGNRIISLKKNTILAKKQIKIKTEGIFGHVFRKFIHL